MVNPRLLSTITNNIYSENFDFGRITKVLQNLQFTCTRGNHSSQVKQYSKNSYWLIEMWAYSFHYSLHTFCMPNHTPVEAWLV